MFGLFLTHFIQNLTSDSDNFNLIQFTHNYVKQFKVIQIFLHHNT